MPGQFGVAVMRTSSGPTNETTCSPICSSSPGSSPRNSIPAEAALPPSSSPAADGQSPTTTEAAIAPDGSSKTASTNGPGPSSSHSTTATIVIRWAELSERGQALLRTVGVPISVGYSEREIARGLGMPTRWVSEALVELQDELRQLG